MNSRSKSENPTSPLMKKRKSWFLFAGALGVAASATLYGAPEAARVTATAVAEIVGVRSGIVSTSNFLVGLPTVTSDSDVVVTVAATSEETTAKLNAALTKADVVSQPAIFGVSGEPNQVFSVSIPKHSTTQTSTSQSGEETVVVFSDYAHDAGINPTIGGDGTAIFAVGARVSVDGQGASLDQEDQDEEKAQGPINDSIDGFSGNEITQPSVETGNAGPTGADPFIIDTQAQNGDALELGLNNDGKLLTSSGTDNGSVTAALRQHNPFSFAVDPRFLNVLVSYN